MRLPHPKAGKGTVFVILGISLCAAVLLSVGVGAVGVSPLSLPRIILHGIGFRGVALPSQRDVTIIVFLRLPRICAALLVGSALATCGAAMQGLFRNPMASPEILGVSAGGSLGAVIAITVGFSEAGIFSLPLLTIAGAFIAAALIYVIGSVKGTTSLLFIVIAGMAISSLFNGITSALLLFSKDQDVSRYIFWTMGGLEGRSWQHVGYSAPILLAGIVFLSIFARELNLFALGEQNAASLGVGVEPTKRLLLSGCAVVTGVAISVSGPVGFVGLLVPHFMRLLIGSDHRSLIPASAMGGGLFLLLCDLLGRVIAPPFEIRVGIITAILGSPYLLSLIIRTQTRRAQKA